MHLTKVTTIVYTLFGLLAPLAAFAQRGGLDETAKTAYGDVPTATLPQVIGTVIRAALTLVGVIFLILMVYGGYLWMIARGNDELIQKAKDTIRSAIIGIIIVVGAYAITDYLIGAFSRPAATPPAPPPSP